MGMPGLGDRASLTVWSSILTKRIFAHVEHFSDILYRVLLEELYLFVDDVHTSFAIS